MTDADGRPWGTHPPDSAPTDQAPPDPTGPDFAPLVRAAQGDALALNEVMSLLMPYVGRVCAPIARQDAPGAAQEAMIAIVRNLPPAQGPRSTVRLGPDHRRPRGRPVREPRHGRPSPDRRRGRTPLPSRRRATRPARRRVGHWHPRRPGAPASRPPRRSDASSHRRTGRAVGVRDPRRPARHRPFTTLPRPAVPTRLLGGAPDPAIRPALPSPAGAPGDRLTAEVLPGCGHFLPHEPPEEVAAVRRLFADGVRP